MRPLKINDETVHFNYADRIGNLTAEAVGVVKGEKHFPVYSGNRIFKPLSKSKPFSTPLFAYAEVFWSNVINEYFVSAPLYQLAFCHGYEEETQKYYDYGTVVPRIYNEDEQLLNLLEFFRKYPDKKVDIDQYENYCMMFYDYTDILEASYFQNHKDMAEQLAMQILVSVLKGDQNYHYENIAFVCNKKGEILRLAPMIDHEFSTYFMFPDNSAQHMYWYSELIRSMEGHEVQDYEYDCLKNPKERQMMEKSAVCLHKNLVYIKEHYPEVTGKFIEKLNCLEHDLEENPSPFYLQENIEYPGTANSYAYMSGKARYKDHDEEKAKLLEEKYPYYMIMALAIQKDSGIEDLLFTSSLEKTLTSQFALKFISLDKFSFAVLARPEDKEEILAGLQEAAEEASKTTRLFAGIREYCTDIRELQTEYRLAENCLLSAQVLPMENFAFQENAAVLPRKRLGQEVQNRLFEYARNGALDQLLPELKEIFYPAGGCSLSDCRFHYQEVWAVFEKACLAKKKAMPHLSDEIPLYNPEYLCQQLTRIATESFPSRREQPQNMQQCMEKYIADHLSEPLTLDTVAEAFSITPVYLSSWFKKNLGVNFLNYISAARMERAGELLCQPNPPKIYEVALAVGIDNTATFIRQFKKHTGLTPSQYQKERLLQKQQGALLGGKTLS